MYRYDVECVGGGADILPAGTLRHSCMKMACNGESPILLRALVEVILVILRFFFCFLHMIYIKKLLKFNDIIIYIQNFIFSIGADYNPLMANTSVSNNFKDACFMFGVR